MRHNLHRSTFKTRGSVLFPIFLLILGFLAALGWALNVSALFEAANDPITGLFILRCIGIFVFPLGSVLGYC